MANICSVAFKLVGKQEDIQKFLDAVEHKTDTWCGRGAELCIDSTTPIEGTDKVAIIASGWTKWSVQSSMIDNAYEIQHQIETGEGYWTGIEKCKRSVDIFTFAKELDISFEYYSEESGCCFQEHGLYNADTQEELTEETDYEEFYVGDYETKEEAEEDLDEKFTDEEWENMDDCNICRGGFASHDFSI